MDQVAVHELLQDLAPETPTDGMTDAQKAYAVQWIQAGATMALVETVQRYGDEIADQLTQLRTQLATDLPQLWRQR